MDALLFCKDLLHNLLDDLEHLDYSLPNFAWYGQQCLKASLVDDDLPLLVDCAWNELRPELEARCREQQVSWQQLLDAEGYDLIWETADQHTPIWDNVLRALYFLYGRELEDAFNNARIYDTLPKNFLQVCVCLYLEQQLTARAEAHTLTEPATSPS